MRRVLSLLLLTAFAGASPVLAFELERDETGSLSAPSPHAALAASSCAAEPRVTQGLGAPRAMFVCSAVSLFQPHSRCEPVGRAAPRPRPTVPELFTCPSQAP